MEKTLPPALPWLEWSPGDRVVVRYRAEDGVHDALGTLLQVERDFVVVETKRGPVRVEAQTMITGKKVPAAPVWPPGLSRDGVGGVIEAPLRPDESEEAS